MNLASLNLSEDVRPNMSRRIAQALRDAIVALELKPGDTISESDIASRFGVSRQPVREAFIQLSEQGLVRVRPQRSTEIVRISMRDVLNARFVRVALEVAVVRKAAEIAPAIAPDVFEEFYAAQAAASGANDYRSFHRHDDGFHRMIAKLSGHEFVWKIVDAQKIQMDRVRYLSLAFGMPATIDEHRGIGKAVIAGDADEAERLMRIHLHKIDTRLNQIRDANREYFAEE
ncbi:MAG: GntR family transcriptional regulator [Mesorhizobium sp.]